MTEMFEELSVATISGGDALKQADHWLGEAVRNCLDPNTLVDKDRTVTLTIKLRPNNDRTAADLSFGIATKFPCDAPLVDMVQIAKKRGIGYVSTAQENFDDILNRAAGESVIDLETGEVKS